MVGTEASSADCSTVMTTRGQVSVCWGSVSVSGESGNATVAAYDASAATLGGHARVGFENNLWRPDGRPAASNAAQVADLAGLARALGIAVATGAQARALFTGEA